MPSIQPSKAVWSGIKLTLYAASKKNPPAAQKARVGPLYKGGEKQVQFSYYAPLQRRQKASSIQLLRPFTKEAKSKFNSVTTPPLQKGADARFLRGGGILRRWKSQQISFQAHHQ